MLHGLTAGLRSAFSWHLLAQTNLLSRRLEQHHFRWRSPQSAPNVPAFAGFRNDTVIGLYMLANVPMAALPFTAITMREDSVASETATLSSWRGATTWPSPHGLDDRLQ